MLGRRLSCNEMNRILVKRSGARKPDLLLKLAEMSAPEEVTEEARRLLEGEIELEREYRAGHESSR